LLENGELNTNASFAAFAKHAVSVFDDTQKLIKAIVEYVAKHGAEGEVDVDDYKMRMQSILPRRGPKGIHGGRYGRHFQRESCHSKRHDAWTHFGRL
jgi:hypothetical protein